MLKRKWGLTALVAVGLLVSACGGGDSTGEATAASEAAAESSVEASAAAPASPASSSSAAAVDLTSLNLNEDGKLIVGMNLQFPPQMYLDEANEPAGYDVQLLNKLAEDLGVELSIQNLDFNGLIPGLVSQQFDMVSVGLTPTEERKQSVDFTRSYVPYAQVLGASVDSDLPADLAAWNTPDVTITALQGSTAETLAQKTFPEANVVSFPDQNAAILEVASGRANGVVLEDALLAQYDKSNPGQVKPVEFPEPLNVEYGSWAVQKGNTALQQYLDQWLCQAQQANQLSDAYVEVFGTPTMPPMPDC